MTQKRKRARSNTQVRRQCRPDANKRNCDRGGDDPRKRRGVESEISQSCYSKGGNGSLIACADAAPSGIASGTVLIRATIHAAMKIVIGESAFVSMHFSTYRDITENFFC